MTTHSLALSKKGKWICHGTWYDDDRAKYMALQPNLTQSEEPNATVNWTDITVTGTCGGLQTSPTLPPIPHNGHISPTSRNGHMIISPLICAVYLHQTVQEARFSLSCGARCHHPTLFLSPSADAYIKSGVVVGPATQTHTHSAISDCNDGDSVGVVKWTWWRWIREDPSIVLCYYIILYKSTTLLRFVFSFG